MKEVILGYRVERLSLDECVEGIIDHLSSSSRGEIELKWLACLNPHSYVVSLNDADFALALGRADWLLPDGVGVVLASRFLGGQIHRRITGMDVFDALNTKMNLVGGMSVFFLGGTTDTLQAIQARWALEFPNVRLAGVFSPAFKENYSKVEIEEMLSTVNCSGADVLWVGMTAPKQEKWLSENAHLLNVRFAGAVGAVFDFYGGSVKRSPIAFQKLGLEWLPRLIRQPKRLWRRMFISAPIFIWRVIKAKF